MFFNKRDYLFVTAVRKLWLLCLVTTLSFIILTILIVLFLFLFWFLFVLFCFFLFFAETASERSASDPPEVVINQLRKLDLPQRGTHLDVGRLPVDILLLTVEDCEFLSCLSYLNPAFCKNFHRDLGYVYLGDLGKDERKLNVAVMNCYRGSASAGGSMVVVLNAVKVLRPKAVFCVGSCRSLDCNKVKLGDVVVLEKLITYGPCKITEGGIEERGVKAPLKSGLLKVILRASDGWQPPLKDLNAREVEIHRGAFLSGAEEVIDRKRCEVLIERFPEVVAIEREGEGKRVWPVRNLTECSRTRSVK